MNSCFDVATFFLKNQDTEAGDLMSNMRLQKLVYYAQGFYLAYTDKPLFEEPIEAWESGPVCPSLFDKYANYETDMIPIPFEEDAYNIFDQETMKILKIVDFYYGQFSAWKLRNLTHEDTPWINAYNNGKTVISLNEMKEYFKSQIDGED